MRRPGGLRGFVGTPVVTLAVVGIGGWFIYVWTQNPEAWPLAFIGLAAMGWAAEANGKVAEYASWKRAWDSMAPGGATRGAAGRPAAKIAMLAAFAIGLGLYLAAHRDQPGNELALNWLVGAGFILLVGSLAVLRFRSTARPIWARRRKPHHAEAVSICVGSPLIRVPDLKGAYDALPPHCWTVLNAR